MGSQAGEHKQGGPVWFSSWFHLDGGELGDETRVPLLSAKPECAFVSFTRWAGFGTGYLAEPVMFRVPQEKKLPAFLLQGPSTTAAWHDNCRPGLPVLVQPAKFKPQGNTPSPSPPSFCQRPLLVDLY